MGAVCYCHSGLQHVSPMRLFYKLPPSANHIRARARFFMNSVHMPKYGSFLLSVNCENPRPWSQEGKQGSSPHVCKSHHGRIKALRLAFCPTSFCLSGSATCPPSSAKVKPRAGAVRGRQRERAHRSTFSQSRSPRSSVYCTVSVLRRCVPGCIHVPVSVKDTQWGNDSVVVKITVF